MAFDAITGFAPPALLQALRAARRRLLFRPRGARFGPGSEFRRSRKIFGAQYLRVGANVCVGEHCRLELIDQYGRQRFSPQLIIGDDVNIGRYFFLTCVSRITIGDRCLFSSHVYIADSAHGMDPDAGPMMSQDLIPRGEVTIGRGCFLGYRAIIMPGVTLGDHCVVGAQSVVTRSFPAHSVVAGVPARLIRDARGQTAVQDSQEDPCPES